MEDICPKRSALREANDRQCSSCGLIYAKYRQARHIPAPAEPEKHSSGFFRLLLVVAMVLMAAVIISGWHTTTAARTASADSSPGESLPPVTGVGQRQAEDATARATARIMAQYRQWQDSIAVAQNVSQSSLGEYIAALQNIRRNTASVPVPPCLLPAQQSLLDSMNHEIDGFLLRLRDANASTEAAAEYFEDARNAANVFEKRVGECPNNTEN